MIIETLSVKNFMPYYGRHEVKFAADTSHMVTIIFGENMRGKTSLLNAMRWCLYGTAQDRNRSAIPLFKLINRDAWQSGDREFEAAIKFSFEGSQYDLRRTCLFPPSAPQAPRDTHAQRQSFLLKDGQSVSPDQIDRLLARCAPEQTSRFLLFDAELLAEYEDLVSDAQGQGERIRKEIENQLGLPIIKNGIANFRTLRSEHVKRAEKATASSEQHRQQQDELRKQQEIVEAAKNELSKLLSEKEAVESKLNEVDESLSQNESAMRLLADLRSLKAQEAQLQDEKVEAQENRATVVTDLWKDVLSIYCAPIIERIEGERELLIETRIEQRVSLRFAQLLKESIEKGACSLCNQSLIGESIEAIRRASAEQGSERGRSSGEKAAEDKSAVTLAHLRSITARGGIERLREMDDRLSRLAVTSHRIDSSKEEIERQLAGIDQAELDSLRRQREELKFRDGSLTKSIDIAKARVDEANIQLDKRSKLLLRIAPSTGNEHRQAELCEAMLELFEGCQESLRENLKAGIEKNASMAFRELSTEADYRGLRINANYGLTILDSAEREVSLRSAGAEQIVALALIDALSKTTNRKAPIFIDTPFARLDLKHRENVLRYLPKMAPQVVLFVHEGEYRSDSSTPITPFIGKRYRITRVSESRSEVTVI